MNSLWKDFIKYFFYVARLNNIITKLLIKRLLISFTYGCNMIWPFGDILPNVLIQRQVGRLHNIIGTVSNESFNRIMCEIRLIWLRQRVTTLIFGGAHTTLISQLWNGEQSLHIRCGETAQRSICNQLWQHFLFCSKFWRTNMIR